MHHQNTHSQMESANLQLLGLCLKISSFHPAFNKAGVYTRPVFDRGPAFNQENTLCTCKTNTVTYKYSRKKRNTMMVDIFI